MTSNIAIVGGGLSGRLTAMQLAERGCAVSLFEKGGRAGENAAAYVAAAMLAPAAEAADATPEAILLGEKSVALWRGIIGRLKTPAMMQENGSLIVWHTQDKPLAVQFEQRLNKAGAQSVHWHSDDIAANEPQLAGRFSDGLYLPAEGQLDNRQVLNALADQLDTLGVKTHWHTETAPEKLAGQYDWIIDCRGYGAKDAWNNRPSENGSRLRGVRGEVVRVYAPEVELRRPVRLLHPRYPLYIAPKENHLFVIGATQLESESQAPVSVRSGLELLSALYAVHPAFGEAQVVETGTGLRPTLNHHNPAIRYDTAARIIEINGLFRHGFMIAPAVTAAAVRLADCLFDGKPAPDFDEESGLAYIKL